MDSTLEIEFPQMVIAHFYHEVNDQFAILAQADWEDWSSFEDIPLSTSTGVSGAIPRNWKDTYKLGAGIHYRPSKPWLLMTGLAYDSSPVPRIEPAGHACRRPTTSLRGRHGVSME